LDGSFPAIAKAAKKLDVATAILDGEAVVLDEQGRSDFGLLQQSPGGRPRIAPVEIEEIEGHQDRFAKCSNFFAAPFAQGASIERATRPGETRSDLFRSVSIKTVFRRGLETGSTAALEPQEEKLAPG
jgi:hypothetical protein